MFLFFDTETTGLPASYTAPFSDSANWPRLVQIARLVYDKKNRLTKRESHIIKPVGFTIPREASRVHGITTAKAKKEGEKLSTVLDLFVQDMLAAEHVIGHNVSFDVAIVSAEFYRIGYPDYFADKHTFCTMKELAHIAAIPGKKGFKRPTMTELHTALFGTPFAGAHDALADIEACAACYRNVFGAEKKTSLHKKKTSRTNHPLTPSLTKRRNIQENTLLGQRRAGEDSFEFDTIGNRALALMAEGKRNIFLTGKAGTGKSTLLLTFLKKNIKNTAIVAPTGVAAVNIGGATIHSFFGFPPTVTVEHARKEGKMRKGDPLFTKLQTVVIDEISMVRADLFDCMDVFLQTARGSDQPFGGVQMICIGDIYQLPPVVTSPERKFFQTVYKSPYFFDAHVFQHPQRDMEFIELEKIYRQTDEAFVGLLNAVRNNTVNESHISLCNQRVIGDVEEIPDGMLYLTGKNAIVDEINMHQLARLSGKSCFFSAHMVGDIATKQFPTDDVLELKVGAQVMFVANNAMEGRYNGTIGKVVSLTKDDVQVELPGGDIVAVAPYTRNVRQYVFDTSVGHLSSKDVGSFTQLPLTLARAVTIHKSQGKTFDRVIIDLGHGIFAHGQTYVALSRCRSLEGMHLVAPLQKSHVIMDRRVTDFITKYQYAASAKIMSTEDKIQYIQKAIAEKKLLDIVYLKAKDVKSQRIVEPRTVGEMVYAGKKFIGMTCLCHKRHEERIFAVPRILDIQVV